MLRVLLFPEGGAWIAQCLELDVCAQGRTEVQAVANLRDTLGLHKLFDAKLNAEPFQDVQWETPKALEEKFKSGKPWTASDLGATLSVREVMEAAGQRHVG